MRFSLAAPLVLAALGVLSARADTTYNFVLSDLTTGTDALSFKLAPSTPFQLEEGSILYERYPGAYNTTKTTFDDIEFTPGGGSESLFIVNDAGVYADTVFLGQEFLTGPADGTPRTITEGSFSGSVPCDIALRSPMKTGSGLPETMAFLQIQSPVAFNCGDSVNLTITGPGVTPPSSVTPEPSSLMLLGTGVLGVAGVMRRRLQV